jgi:hypothetical protein
MAHGLGPGCPLSSLPCSVIVHLGLPQPVSNLSTQEWTGVIVAVAICLTISLWSPMVTSEPVLAQDHSERPPIGILLFSLVSYLGMRPLLMSLFAKYGSTSLDAFGVIDLGGPIVPPLAFLASMSLPLGLFLLFATGAAIRKSSEGFGSRARAITAALGFVLVFYMIFYWPV